LPAATARSRRPRRGGPRASARFAPGVSSRYEKLQASCQWEF
jgi:hypothetical protein